MIKKILNILKRWFCQSDSEEFLFKNFDFHTPFSHFRYRKRLQLLATLWNQQQPHLQSSELTPFDEAQLYEASFWPSLLEEVFKSPRLQDNFFKWTLRDKNSVEIFARFPDWALRLLKANLSQRIGRLNGKGLKIEEGHLTLLFEGKKVPLTSLDQVVVLKHAYRLTLGEVLKVFENKAYDVGNLEYCKEGIINWNTLELGSWVPFEGVWKRIDLDRPDWYNELPAFETLTPTEIKERYNIDEPPAQQWVLSAVSTRGSLNLDYNNTHAFLELAIPNGAGSYQIYNFGKFSIEFPKTALDRIKMLCRTTEARVSYPDENVYFTFREQALYPLLLFEHEGREVLDSIKKDILTGWKGNFVYQIESENCAKWVHYKLEVGRGSFAIPDLFRMPLLDTQPGGPVSALFALIKWLPLSMRVPLLTFLHLPLGARQSIEIEEEGVRVAKSLSTHEFFRHGEVFLPALLNHKVLVQLLLQLRESLTSQEIEAGRHFLPFLRGLSLRPLSRFFQLLFRSLRDYLETGQGQNFSPQRWDLAFDRQSS